MSQIARTARHVFKVGDRFASTVSTAQVNEATQKAAQTARSYANKLSDISKPVIYQSKVAAELAKQVYQKEGMAFPTPKQFEDAVTTLKANANVRTIRSMGLDNIARIGVHVVEAYFIFVIGEIIGRRSLIGYNIKSNVKKEHH